MSEQIFPAPETKVTWAPHIEALATLLNAVAGVAWVLMFILLAVSPAVTLAVWRVLL